MIGQSAGRRLGHDFLDKVTGLQSETPKMLVYAHLLLGIATKVEEAYSLEDPRRDAIDSSL